MDYTLYIYISSQTNINYKALSLLMESTHLPSVGLRSWIKLTSIRKIGLMEKSLFVIVLPLHIYVVKDKKHISRS